MGFQAGSGLPYATVTYGRVSSQPNAADRACLGPQPAVADCRHANPLWGNPAARKPLKLEVLDRSQAGERQPRPETESIGNAIVSGARPAAVIVLAAGGGTRMKSATAKEPVV